ncbi:helicase-associated domain-containing protein [Microbacterium sp. Marseille-Q6648]|uniref:helicase-associated domain-containing protein n=1 Tax=Microbacterium sp. Marseille-Q6648 TaxID=2937991 RepID=UPI00203D8DFF|nr:helicase-associated domain-containing protein [Microbacterium sp. Marseille-Q6648]
MPSDERALATWLAGRDDVALAETFAVRGVSPAATWHDFFDVAENLLDPASIDRAVAQLPRPVLAALATDAATGAAASLERFALADPDGRPLEIVRSRLAAARASNPDAFAPLKTPDAAQPSNPQQAAAAAETIFTTAGALADVLLAGLTSPLSRTGTGAVSAFDRKKLVESGAVVDGAELDALVALAKTAGLVIATDREWTVTDAAGSWLESSTAERWALVAEGFRSSLPAGLRTDDGGWVALDVWPEMYPLAPDWAATATRLRDLAVRWGLVGTSGDEPPWAQSLRSGAPADPSSLLEHLPAEIDRVYLQADLSAIAPGPLSPPLDLRLRRIAVRESRAQASTYRFTAGSLATGMTEGEDADGIRAFLSELSLTGIPQPLDYLIDSTAARHGRVRVSEDAATGRTRVDSDDAGLLDTVAVDQALRPLGLVDDGASLTTRVARDAVYWALADARYPVVAVDGTGHTVAMHRRTGSAQQAAGADLLRSYDRLLESLRSGHGEGDDGAWLQRELEQSVRTRSELVVVVRMPDGGERSFILEATGLGGGRLRGRDRAADIERTLPVSSIVSVRAPGTE